MNDPQYQPLPDSNFWNLFKDLAVIPHVSGHETELRDKIIQLARMHHLSTQVDQTGNLRICRPAAPGKESCPKIILQGHLDMVGECTKGLDFDFITQSVSPVREGDWISTGDKTTLGADNLVGVVAALNRLFDPEWNAGELIGLFTVEEETGLSGAQGIDPSWLQADFLLNLDSEEDGQFIIGCAGGARLETTIPISFVPTTRHNTIGLKVELSGLPGGHSGCDIADNRGNAIILLSQYLHLFPGLQLSSINGGAADNAIPRACTAEAAVSTELLQSMKSALDFFVGTAREELGNAGKNLKLELTQIPAPKQVWPQPEQALTLSALAHCPNGAMLHNEQYHCVAVSSNLAMIRTNPDNVVIHSSQRAFDDEERETVTGRLLRRFEKIGGNSQVTSAYPGWKPAETARLQREAIKVFQQLRHEKPVVSIIHAGLECGIFSGKNPALEMISFGPDLQHPHSPNERLHIPTTESFLALLASLLEHLQHA